MSEMAQVTGNIDHAARTHAALSASSSHRWLMCTPSVKLSEQFVDKPSVYAEEGTFLHELSEMKLHRYLGDMTLEAAYAKIMFLLSQGVTGSDFGKWMKRPIAGEISPSSL